MLVAVATNIIGYTMHEALVELQWRYGVVGGGVCSSLGLIQLSQKILGKFWENIKLAAKSCLKGNTAGLNCG